MFTDSDHTIEIVKAPSLGTFLTLPVAKFTRISESVQKLQKPLFDRYKAQSTGHGSKKTFLNGSLNVLIKSPKRTFKVTSLW